MPAHHTTKSRTQAKPKNHTARRSAMHTFGKHTTITPVSAAKNTATASKLKTTTPIARLFDKSAESAAILTTMPMPSPCAGLAHHTTTMTKSSTPTSAATTSLKPVPCRTLRLGPRHVTIATPVPMPGPPKTVTRSIVAAAFAKPPTHPEPTFREETADSITTAAAISTTVPVYSPSADQPVVAAPSRARLAAEALLTTAFAPAADPGRRHCLDQHTHAHHAHSHDHISSRRLNNQAHTLTSNTRRFEYCNSIRMYPKASPLHNRHAK
ncbi:hypothetical protein H0H81_004967, partial [Sphagnurus paluster]